jgi:hypothetical protein
MKRISIFILLSIPIFIYADISKEQINNLMIAREIGIDYGLPKGLSEAIAWEESKGLSNAKNKNNKGDYFSRGLFQINTQFEEELANKYFPGKYENFNIWSSIDNSILGIKYIKDLYKRFGRWDKALWAYNWGPKNVENIKTINDVPIKVRIYAIHILSRIRF